MSKTVFVGVSGGVDSSVAAYLLKKKGFNVVGVYIKSWYPAGFPCPYPIERRDAIRVCAKLNIPFLEFDFERVYKKYVADYLIKEYKKGNTPNPDVMCNKFVKFDAFLKKARKMGADCIATGHYVRLKNNQLYQAKDRSKDQSYFLWSLTKEQLEYSLFPVGDYLKKEVREIAKKIGLPTAEKPDSQGICFLGEIDTKSFLKKYIKEKKGKVLNEAGVLLGFHEGASFYTLGERVGFRILKKTPVEKPYYAISKDVKKNTITVSHELRKKDKYQIKSINWILDKPKLNKVYKARIRHLGELYPVKISNLIGKKAEIKFLKPVLAASGQSLVFYDKEKCLGGGVITSP